ncbi:MAG: hypothetical protein WBM32_09940 [Crocosphaera sp.]|jgi:hypothetical protein
MKTSSNTPKHNTFRLFLGFEKQQKVIFSLRRVNFQTMSKDKPKIIEFTTQDIEKILEQDPGTRS